MKLEIQKFDNAIQSGSNPEGLSFQALSAYEDSKDAGFDRINFSGIIWDKDIAGVTESLKNSGVTEFTISNQSSGILETLSGFEASGAVVMGLTKITGRKGTVPAFLMKII